MTSIDCILPQNTIFQEITLYFISVGYKLIIERVLGNSALKMHPRLNSELNQS